MTSLARIEADLGLREYMNCVLVQNDVRPGMLLQSIDYDEPTFKGPHTSKKVNMIQRLFPSLKIVQMHGSEVLVSKQTYSPDDFRTSDDIGRAIGYPCVDDYKELLRNDVQFSQSSVAINVYAYLSSKPDEPIQLFANACKDTTHLESFQRIAAAAQTVLQADPIVGSLVTSVQAVVDQVFPIDYLVTKLQAGESLTDKELDETVNYFYNFGFSDQFPKEVIQVTNPVHRGIMIALLLYYKHDPLDPFYPLTNYPGKNVETDGRLMEWQDALIASFEETRIPEEGGSRRGLRRGSKQRTRRVKAKRIHAKKIGHKRRTHKR